MDAAEGSIVVKAPVAAVYARWLAFEDYPKFISVINGVRKLDASHFVASLEFNGKQREAMVEIMLRISERRLAWRTVSNDHAPNHLATGVVSFASYADRSTCITFKVTSSFGGGVSQSIANYLQNFKALVESDAAAR